MPTYGKLLTKQVQRGGEHVILNICIMVIFAIVGLVGALTVEIIN